MTLIAVAGAPGSGKSVAAAQIYAAIHTLGYSEPRYVPEFAHKYLGRGYSIKSVDSQLEITNTQLDLELEEVGTGGQTVICDSALWIGYPYFERLATTEDDLVKGKKLYSEYNNRYDLVFYAPLVTESINHYNDFRIHTYDNSLGLDASMRNYILSNDIKNVYYLPDEYHMRESFIKVVMYEYLMKNKNT